MGPKTLEGRTKREKKGEKGKGYLWRSLGLVVKAAYVLGEMCPYGWGLVG